MVMREEGGEDQGDDGNDGETAVASAVHSLSLLGA
jgi:hypothetical protein